MTTGISARDRAQTIRTAIDPSTRPEDLGSTRACVSGFAVSAEP